MKKLINLLALATLLMVPSMAKAQCDDGELQCSVTIIATDSYGDGWNGAAINIYQGVTLRGTVTVPNDGGSGHGNIPHTFEVAVCSGDSVRFEWTSGSYNSECSYIILNGNDDTIHSGSGSMPTITAEVSCPNCIKVLNLTADSLTNEGATISWTGNETAQSYLVYVNGELTADSPVTGTTYTFSGLEANTDYSYSVRSYCGNGDTSSASSGTFRTLCQNGNCEITLNVSQYSYCGTVAVMQNGGVLDNVTFSSSSGTSKTVEICNGDSLILIYTQPSYSYSTSTWHIIDAGDSEIGTFTNAASTGDTVLAVANGCPSCIPPTDLQVSNITSTGATFTWQTSNGETEWAVYIEDTERDEVASDGTVEITGLEPNTPYTFRVRAICVSGEDSSNYRSISFRTACEGDACDLTVKCENTYSYGTYGLPEVDVLQRGSVLKHVAGTSTFSICSGDSLSVVLKTVGSYTPTVTIIDAGETEMARVSTAGMSVNTVIFQTANGCPSCIPPQTVTQTPEDAFSTTIHWTDNNGDGLGNYVIIINEDEFYVSGDTSYILATYPLTHYDVRVARICDGEDTSAWRSLGFNAPCDESVYAQVPFSSGFEDLNTGDMPSCWLQVATGTNTGLTPNPVFPSAYRHTPNAHNSDVYFEFESNQGETEILALPRMEDIPNLQLTFYASVTNSTYNFIFEAGVIEQDEAGAYVFVPVDTVNLIPGSSFSNSYHVYNVTFDSYTGNGERLAIRTTPTGTATYTLMIDDFSVIYVGLPVLSPFNPATHTVNVDTTMGFKAHLMAGDNVNYLWTSSMGNLGFANLSGETTDSVTITYTDSGIDTLRAIASTEAGSDTEMVIIYVIDPSPISVFPYSTSFEDGEDISWNYANNASGWYIGNAAYLTGGRGLYVSSTHGATNVYSNQASANSYAYRQFQFPEAGEYELSFNWKGDGGSDAYLRAYLRQGQYVPTAGSSPSGTPICGNLYDQTSWNEFSTVIDVDTGLYTLVFYWYNNYQSTNDNPPAAIDDLTIERLNCSRVGNLTASNIFAHSADISWTPRNGETSWYVQVDSTEGEEVYDTLVNLSGFDGESQHTVIVRALCGNGDSSFASTVSFTTTIACPAVTNIHTNDVTGTTATIAWTPGGEETAWKVCVDGGDTIDVSDTTYTVTNLLPVTSHTIKVMADCGDLDGQSLESNYTFNTLCDDGSCDIAFHLTDSYSGMDGWNGGSIRVIQNGIQIGNATIANGSNVAEVYVPVCSSMPVALVFNAGSYPHEMGGTVETQDGTVVYTISGMTSSMNGDTLATVDVPCPTCLPATNLVVDTFTANTITISWQPTGDNTTWAVYANDVLVSNTVTDTTYTFTTLDANTIYTVGVRALCEDNDSSAMRTATVRTACSNGNCEFTIEMTDQYNDGWNGNAIYIYQNGELFETATIPTGNNRTMTLSPCLGDPVALVWHTGSYITETSFVIKDANDSTLLTVSNATGSSTACSNGDTLVIFDGQCNANVVFVPGTQPGSCSAPTNLTTTATENSITLNFTAVSDNIDGYEVEIVNGAWSGSMGNAVSITTNSYTFTNLQSNTQYTVAVRTVCDSAESEYSNWATTSATTQSVVVSDCNTPTDIDVVAGTTHSTSATIRWTENGNATKWALKISTTGFDSTYTVTSNPYTVNGLTPSTTYYMQVRAICSDSLQSGWSDLAMFQTAQGDGIDGVDMLGVELFPNPASSIVTIQVAEKAEVTLVDLNGRVNGVWSVENGKLTVDVSTIAQGTYFVRVVGESGIAVRKLVIK